MVNSGPFSSQGDGNIKSSLIQQEKSDTNNLKTVKIITLCHNNNNNNSDNSEINKNTTLLERDNRLNKKDIDDNLIKKTKNNSHFFCSLPLNKVEKILTTINNKQINKNLIDIKLNSRKILCLYCERTFVNVNLKEKHVERCHSIKQIRRFSSRNSNNNNNQRNQNNITCTPCIYCDKLTKIEYTLNELFQHLINNHSNKYFACLPCELRFLNLTLLNEHNASIHDQKQDEENYQQPITSSIRKLSSTTTRTTSTDNLRNLSTIINNKNETKEEIPIKLTRSKMKSKNDDNSEIINDKSVMKKKLSSTKDLHKNNSKKLTVKSSKIAIKRSKRLQAKVNETQNKKRRTKNSTTPTSDDNIINKKLNDFNLLTTNTTKLLNKSSDDDNSSTVNPYPEFDNYYRVKKITDHSIDNLKISSLTFDDVVFDKAFFNRIKCNIQDNLLHHIDGKLFKNEESENRISNFEKIKSMTMALSSTITPTTSTNNNQFNDFQQQQQQLQQQQQQQMNNLENYGCELSLNAVTPTTTLSSTTQFGEDFESQIEYGSKPSNSKKKSSASSSTTLTTTTIINNPPTTSYKYFTRRKYQASILESKENRDLSKLDMWTQYIIKKRQEKILNNKKSAKEKLDYQQCNEYKLKLQRKELNRILDRRGPFEDLKEEVCKKAALDKLNLNNNGNNISEESFNEVRLLINDILNCVYEQINNNNNNKDNDIYNNKTTRIIDKRKPNNCNKEIKSELPSYLQLQRKSLTLNDDDDNKIIDKSDKIALICSSQETENFELPTNQQRNKNEKIELTGEWARTRIFICGACGLKLLNIKQLLEHKSIYHQNVWVQHYEFVGNQSELYRNLCIPCLGKVGYIEDNLNINKQFKKSNARLCTKCKKMCNSLGELHRHVLECGGDWTWMLARKKCKYRPFGAKSRRKRRGLIKRICTQKSEPSEKKPYNKKTFDGPRPKPSDADTIQRMLANLPAKRITRKIMSLKDGFHNNNNNNNNNTTTKNNQQNSTSNNLKRKKLTNDKNKSKNDIKVNNSNNVNNNSNKRPLRNKVLGSSILDTTTSLIVKRKFKNSKTLNNKLNVDNEKEDIEVTTSSKLNDNKQSAKNSTKVDKSTKLSINKKLVTKPTNKMSIKNFFNIRKNKNVDIVDDNSINVDNSLGKKLKGKRKLNENDENNKNVVVDNDNDDKLKIIKKSKKELSSKTSSTFGNFVRTLSLRKKTNSTQNNDNKKTDLVDNCLNDNDNNQLNDNSNIKKRKIRKSFRKIVVDKITKNTTILQVDGSSQDCLLNEINKLSSSSLTDNNDFLLNKLEKNKDEDKNNLNCNSNNNNKTIDQSIINYSLSKEDLPIPETIFNLKNDDEKILQAKGELDFDSPKNDNKFQTNENSTTANINTLIISNDDDGDDDNEKINQSTIITKNTTTKNIKGKIKKPTKGLNDCIAMLTNKLNQNNKLINNVDSIFNLMPSSIDDHDDDNKVEGEEEEVKNEVTPPTTTITTCILKVPSIREYLEKKIQENDEILIERSKQVLNIPTFPINCNKIVDENILHITNSKEIEQNSMNNTNEETLEEMEGENLEIKELEIEETQNQKKYENWNSVDDTIEEVIKGNEEEFEKIDSEKLRLKDSPNDNMLEEKVKWNSIDQTIEEVVKRQNEEEIPLKELKKIRSLHKKTDDNSKKKKKLRKSRKNCNEIIKNSDNKKRLFLETNLDNLLNTNEIVINNEKNDKLNNENEPIVLENKIISNDSDLDDDLPLSLLFKNVELNEIDKSSIIVDDNYQKNDSNESSLDHENIVETKSILKSSLDSSKSHDSIKNDDNIENNKKTRRRRKRRKKCDKHPEDLLDNQEITTNYLLLNNSTDNNDTVAAADDNIKVTSNKLINDDNCTNRNFDIFNEELPVICDENGRDKKRKKRSKRLSSTDDNSNNNMKVVEQKKSEEIVEIINQSKSLNDEEEIEKLSSSSSTTTTAITNDDDKDKIFYSKNELKTKRNKLINLFNDNSEFEIEDNRIDDINKEIIPDEITSMHLELYDKELLESEENKEIDFNLQNEKNIEEFVSNGFVKEIPTTTTINPPELDKISFNLIDDNSSSKQIFCDNLNNIQKKRKRNRNSKKNKQISINNQKNDVNVGLLLEKNEDSYCDDKSIELSIENEQDLRRSRRNSGKIKYYNESELSDELIDSLPNFNINRKRSKSRNNNNNNDNKINQTTKNDNKQIENNVVDDNNLNDNQNKIKLNSDELFDLLKSTTPTPIVDINNTKNNTFLNNFDELSNDFKDDNFDVFENILEKSMAVIEENLNDKSFIKDDLLIKSIDDKLQNDDDNSLIIEEKRDDNLILIDQTKSNLNNSNTTKRKRLNQQQQQQHNIKSSVHNDNDDNLLKNSDDNESLSSSNQLVKNSKKLKKTNRKVIKTISVDDNSELIFCDICNKTFCRIENLIKHKRTLTHISKLSEIEAKEAAEKLKLVIENDNHVSDDSITTLSSISRNNDDINLSNILLNNVTDKNIDDNLPIISKTTTATTTLTTSCNNDSLKLADIINDVLNKPVLDQNNSNSNKFSDIIMQNSNDNNIQNEFKRCKSLGERKSFDSDNNSTIQNYFEPNTNTGIILEKQITLLQNMIENRTNLDDYIDDISVTSSNQCSIATTTLNNDDNLPIIINEDNSKHKYINDNRNLIQINNNESFLKPIQLQTSQQLQQHQQQYEEISDDSTNLRCYIDEQKSRINKVLNRDEELFLECCSLLKSGSELSNYSKQSSNNKLSKILNQLDMKRNDDVDDNNEEIDCWLENKSLIHNNNNNNNRNKQNYHHQNDDSSRIQTPLGDNFVDDISNSNTITSNWNNVYEKLSSNNDNNNADDNRRDYDDDDNRREYDDDDYDDDNHRDYDDDNKSFTFEEVLSDSNNFIDNNDDNDSSSDDNLGRDKHNNYQSKKKFSNKLSKVVENQLNNLTNKFNRKRCEDLSDGGMDSATNDSHKKLLTKGAKKVFEGLKVSIPISDDLNLNDLVLNRNLKKNFDKSLPKPTKKFKSTSNNTNNKIKSGGTSGDQNNKKKLQQQQQQHHVNINNKELLQHDVYDFEETTQDHSDIFRKSDFRRFRTNKTFDFDDSYDNDDSLIRKNIVDDNLQSLNDDSTASFDSSFSNNSLEGKNEKTTTNENIPKKKCMIMGRIFKNAMKSKIDDENNIDNLTPIEDNEKYVENYVLNNYCNNNETIKKTKMSEEEMNKIFDELVNDNNSSSNSNKNLNKNNIKIEQTKTITTNNNRNNRKSSSTNNINNNRSIKHNNRKRNRLNSNSTDDEFGLNKTIKKRTYRKNTKIENNSINLEQELKECIGVASRKSQRKCTSGKQNVLVEYWSSDESTFDVVLENKKIIEPTLLLGPPPTPLVVATPPPKSKSPPLPTITATTITNSDIVTATTTTTTTETEEIVNKINKPVNVTTNKKLSKKSFSNDRERKKSEMSATTILNRRKRAAANPLYHWSSSSEDELNDLIEIKPIRDDDDEIDYYHHDDYYDDDERPIQHGWIVGDSPKKLVTMLAQAKGKKSDDNSVKEQNKNSKRTINYNTIS